MLVAVTRGNCGKVEHWNEKSNQFERSRCLLISALLGAAYDAVIDSRREYDLVAIQMLVVLVAVAHGNHYRVEQ